MRKIYNIIDNAILIGGIAISLILGGVLGFLFVNWLYAIGVISW